MPRPGDPPQDRRGRDDEGRVGDGGQAVASPWLGHDLATGALNHRGLVERLQTALALARRMETHLALVALALRAHDRGGTEPDGESDLAAATVRELRAAVREHDLVARLARDEFVVVLQVCEEGRARVVAARLLADLERVAAPLAHVRPERHQHLLGATREALARGAEVASNAVAPFSARPTP